MPPELVIADAPSVNYPAGVVAVRATDWLGPARGTLTTETDVLASTGECVRDAQQIVPDVNAVLDEDEYGDADDTLVIPVDDIGLRDGFDYWVWVTYKVDGDWDVTNGALLRNCDEHEFNHVCAIGLHGDDFLTEVSPDLITRLLGHNQAYSVLLSFVTISEGQTLHLRAFAHDGVAAEVLIDQIVFIPDFGTDLESQVVSGDRAGGLTTALTDGADGGDDAGKFTFKDVDAWNALVSNRNSSDYQRYADPANAEWNLQVTPSDNFPLEDNLGNPVTAHGYSLHAVRNQAFSTVDDFDNRTTTTNSQDMGINDDGYGYSIGATGAGTAPAAFVSGGVGIMRLRTNNTTILVRFGDNSQGSSGVLNQGAQLKADDAYIYRGRVENTAGALASGSWRWGFHTGGILWEVRLDPLTGLWQLGYFTGSTWTAVGSSHDISAWFGLGAELGFRIEVRRYQIRLRIWDASGAEPSTWDEDFFKRVQLSGTQYDYPYSDVLARAQAAYSTTVSPWPEIYFQIRSHTVGAGDTLPYDVTLHEMVWERDMYGTAEPMTVYLEQPEGDFVAQQEIPYGCPYFVWWGGRVWTAQGSGFERLTFSSKLVNDSAAAELQRADGLNWHFVSLPGGIVSMNWRSGDRNASSQRILTGA